MLFRSLENPPKDTWFFDYDSTHYRWDTFAAWAFTTLWCENPADPDLSGSVAAFALWRRYTIVERVLNVAALHRDQLEKNFERLFAHAIRYAPVRDYFRHKAQSPEPEANDPDFRKAFSAHITSFLTGKTKPLPASWLELAEPVSVESFPDNIESTGLDVHQIYSSLTWASDLSKGRNVQERTAWIHYHVECLRCALIRIRRLPDKDDDDPYGNRRLDQPYREEELIVDRTGVVLARLNPDEDHRSLWEPIFSLGKKGASWIRHFTSQWMLEAAGHKLPGFIEQWKAMLAFAETSPGWKEDDLGLREMEDMWHYLLGFSPFTREFWDKDLAPAVESVRDSIERWATANVASSDEATTYLRFLQREAAISLRPNGLVILSKASPPDDPKSWTDSSAQDELASLLDKILNQSWADIVANPPAQEAFMALVLKLVSLQKSIGAELLSAAKARLTNSV